MSDERTMARESAAADCRARAAAARLEAAKSASKQAELLKTAEEWDAMADGIDRAAELLGPSARDADEAFWGSSESNTPLPSGTDPGAMVWGWVFSLVVVAVILIGWLTIHHGVPPVPSLQWTHDNPPQ